MRKLLFTICVLVCIVQLTHAQYTPTPITKSTQIEIIDNQKYYIHTVKTKETLYSICKAYGVSIQTIIENNALTENSLNVNQTIRIPYTEKTSSDAVTTSTVPTTEVKKIDIAEDLTLDNIEIDTLPTTSKKTAISLAVCLPFNISKNGLVDSAATKSTNIHESTLPFLEYYEGVLLAIDSLKKQNIQVTLSTFSIDKDTNTVIPTLRDLNTSPVDFIIGPVYLQPFVKASGYARKHKTPIIYPLSSDEIPNKNNSFVIQMNSPMLYRQQSLIDYISKQPNTNVILVYNSVDLEQETINEYKTLCAQKKIIPNEVFFPKLGVAGIKSFINPNAANYIIVTSKNQAFINNLVTTLYPVAKKHDIHLVGLPIWERFENVELDFLFELQFQFVGNLHVDYTNPQIKNFVETYRYNFKTEPTKFSFQGFDHVMMLSQAILQNSTNSSLQDHLLLHPHKGMFDDYSFVKNGNNIINTSNQHIQYTKDFKKIIVK